jgi:uncharacterized protein (TIGR03437 family)
MSAASLAVAVLLLAPSIEARAQQSTLAPSYSTASIVNAATNQPGAFAPNTIVSIYGASLSYNTVSMTLNQGRLPTTLGGVTVYIGHTAAYLFFVSPQQINVLLPYNMLPGPFTLTIVRDGTTGPTVNLTMTVTAPGLFQLSPNVVLATHANGSVITPASPAAASEIIVLYAVGLGQTVPDVIDGFVPDRAMKILDFSILDVLINSVQLDPARVLYAGVTPGFAGLYQINLMLPDNLPSNPEIRVAIGLQASPSFMNLPTVN